MAVCSGIVLVLVIVVGAHVDASCLVDDIQVQANFDLEKYLGHWYEMRWLTAEDPKYWMQDFSNYYTKYNTSVVTIDAYGRSSSNHSCIHFTSQLDLTDTPGKFVTYKGSLAFDYWVVETDYLTYSVVYGCPQKDENGTCAVVESVIFSRTMAITDEIGRTVDAALSQLCLQQSDYMMVASGFDCRADKMRTSTAAPPTGGVTTHSQVALALIAPFLLLINLVAS